MSFLLLTLALAAGTVFTYADNEDSVRYTVRDHITDTGHVRNSDSNGSDGAGGGGAGGAGVPDPDDQICDPNGSTFTINGKVYNTCAQKSPEHSNEGGIDGIGGKPNVGSTVNVGGGGKADDVNFPENPRALCQTPDRTPEEKAKAQEMFEEWKYQKETAGMPPASQTDPAAAFTDDCNNNCVNWLEETITVPTYFHIIYNDTHGKEYTFEENPNYIIDSILIMNKSFRGSATSFSQFDNGARSYPRYQQRDVDTKIQFCLAGNTSTNNAAWYDDMDNVTRNEYKRELRLGGMETLNVFVTRGPFVPIENVTGIGEATFPDEKNPSVDGVVIANRVMPGGNLANFNEGDTLTHEVGHWLNLYHTFEDGCEGPGDYMDDAEPSTNYENVTRYASKLLYLSECPVGADDCSDTGRKSPIHNFMSYHTDKCLDEFSPGQKPRMRAAWETYRHDVLTSKQWGINPVDDYTCCKLLGASCQSGFGEECCSGICTQDVCN